LKNLVIIGELHLDLVCETTLFNLLVEKIGTKLTNFIYYNPDDINKQLLEKIIRNAISDIPKKTISNCTLKRGGNGNNTAEYCASFGIPTYLIAVIGTNTDWMIDELKMLGINTTLIYKKKFQTPISTIIKSQLTTKILIAQNLKQKMNFNGIKLSNDLFLNAKIIYLTPIMDKYKKLLKVALEQDAIVSLNIEAQKIKNYEHLKNIIEDKVDIIFINRNDANLIIGKNLNDNKVDMLYEKFASIRIYTAGSEGSYLFSNSFQIFTPTIQLNDIKDRTGAGDCFAAGFLSKLFELIKNKNDLIELNQSHNSERFKTILSTCMEFATFSAVYKISTQLIPSKKTIEEFIKTSKNP